MLTPDLVDIPIEIFGGYCPAVAPTVLPPGSSPSTQDCYFPEGAVATRGGLAQIFGPGNGIPATASINGLKTYLNPQTQDRLMVWDSKGNFYKESPDGTLNLVSARPQGAGTLYQSTTIFGREYQAFYGLDPLLGLDIPRQFDDTNWDRVSQVGPGSAPGASDENILQAVQASPNGAGELTAGIANSPQGLNQVGFIVTVVCNSTNFVYARVGDQVKITGAGVGGYNGTWTISAILGPGTFQYANTVSGLAASGGGTVQLPLVQYSWPGSSSTLAYTGGQLVNVTGMGVAGYNTNGQSVRQASAPTYVGYGGYPVGAAFLITFAGAGVFGLANSGNGNVNNAGSIAPGLHGISVAFITRQGYITQAAPPSFWTAVGNLRAVANNIAIGPPNIVARLLLFTPVITPPAVTGTFYSLPTGSLQVTTSVMLIPDNVTVTTTVDFTDAILIAGFQAEYLFTEIELGECANVNGYNSRLVWLGERNKVPNFINLTFDGGFTLGALPRFPLGWTPDPVNSSGGQSAVAAALVADWGDAYAIAGDGTKAITGKMTQSAYKDYLGNAILAANTSYSVRARVSAKPGIAAGTLHINLQSTSQAFTTVGLQVPFNDPNLPTNSGASYFEYTAVLGTAALLTTPPSDLLLQLYVDGNLNGFFIVDSVEIFPTLTPYNFSTARISYAFNPEGYDGVLSQIQVRPSDGQMLHASFPIRGNIYFGKDHYLCYTTDDGVNEPSSWTLTEVSATIGICGPNAVDWTEEWAVFAERSGLYIFWGSDPIKITPEIQQDASSTGKIVWNSINWATSHTIWVRIDRINKQILVGAPVNGATTPNVVFMLDYKWLEGPSDIANSPMVTYSAFTGKALAHGRGRRWMLWNISAASMCFAERSNLTSIPLFGNNSGNGIIYQQLQTQLSDNGVAINSFYQTHFAPSHMEEETVGLGAHRKLLGYLKFRAFGVGNLTIQIVTARRTTNLRSYILSLAPAGDGERPTNIHGERFSFILGTNAVGQWFQLEQLIPCMKKDSTIVTRGVSA